MKRVRELIKSFVSDDRGLETVEYAVMMALIVAALVAAVGVLRTAISSRFSATASIISS